MERLADLKPDPQNPRRHGERNVAVVRASIAGDGFGRSLLLANDGTIIAGNATARAAADAGLDRVRVIETDGSEVVAVKRTDVAPDSPAFRRLSVADNRGAELAEWDAAIVAAHAEAGVLDPDAYWNDDEWAALLAHGATPTTGLTDPDAVPEVPKEATTKPGDLWLLGRHRLLCGSATSTPDRARLLGGASPDIILTDPPYSSGGFQEAGKRSGSIGTRQNATLQQDSLSTRGYLSLLSEAITGVNADVLYVFTDWRMWPWTLDVAEREGWPVRNMLVWAKPTMGMGFPWRAQHELILYGKRTSAHLLDGKRGNVLHADRSGNAYHPTEKPVALFVDILTNTEGVLVYDPFAGSGTSVVACESSRTQAVAMELVPAYCDVIVRRWEAFTGQTAVRETP